MLVEKAKEIFWKGVDKQKKVTPKNYSDQFICLL